MFFTHLGRVVAILTLVLAILLIISGARVFTEQFDAEVARYLSRSLERGVYLVGFIIVLGILTEISYALKSLKAP
jgi:divalent metal cation (Fe/Co/Zn/Cd) transporter